MTEEVEVRVRSNGRVIATITRSQQIVDGRIAVSYRGHLWPVESGSIEVGVSSEGRLDECRGGNQAEGMRLAHTFDALTKESSELPSSPTTWEFDPIPHAADARVIVDAGPGTGKTHAACARVAKLVAGGIPATRIMLVSFTRTAVVEIRNRIGLALASVGGAAGVRIITLDSYAWAVQSGYSGNAKLTSGFDHNIECARDLIANDDDVVDDLQKLAHLIIDEAQDIVGPRADLLVELVNAISPDCGVTVFADRAQAIYEFAESKGGERPGGLLDRLQGFGFQVEKLTKVHRTTQANLIKIFTDVREDLLSGTIRSSEVHIRREIVRLAHGDVGASKDLDLSKVRSDALVLMRSRYEVLEASSRSGNLAHRLRTTGLPICVRPWVGQLFWDYSQRRITRPEFEKRWLDRGVQSAVNCDEAWAHCVSVAGDSEAVVDLHALRTALARRNPPMIFCTPEFGSAGPVIGTIHASKGRESPTVQLYLQSATSEVASSEEARVMFVGATRAREQLLVGSSGESFAQSTNNRVWRRTGKLIHLEIGRPGDLDPSGLVGRPFFNKQEEAYESQCTWIAQPYMQDLTFGLSCELGWRFVIGLNGRRMGGMSEAFKSDVYCIERFTKKRITGLSRGRSLGARTMAVAPDSPLLESMLEPWRSSGFLFAPLLSSLSVATLRDR